VGSQTRARRVAWNNRLFHEANRQRERGLVFSTEIELDCECLDEACGEHLLLSAEEYEFLRKFPDYFAVTPDHIRGDSDHVIVCEPHRFAVVQ
jgi:hypothetical protein